jgi:hypothetical protein
MSPRRLMLVGILMEFCYLSFYLTREGRGEVILFICVNVTTYPPGLSRLEDAGRTDGRRVRG